MRPRLPEEDVMAIAEQRGTSPAELTGGSAAPFNLEPGATPASILIVDDHPANLLAFEAILTPLLAPQGHRLVKVASGDEALKQILQRDFALILLDVQMSGMNGFETAALIKQHPRSRHIPIIFITALSRDADHVFRGYSQGAVDYLMKPFEPEILRSKVTVFIDLYLKGETIKLQERMLRQREREASERRSQHRYRSLLDSMPQCVWAASSDGEIYYWNRAGLAYCGVTADQITRDSFWQVIHPDERPLVEADWEATMREGHRAFQRELRLRRASDGAYRWHLGRMVPERNEQGAVIGWIVTAIDIDDHKRAEEDLQRAIVQRDDFLSVASHELRTPLTSLKLEVANLGRLAERNQGVVPADRLGEKLRKIEGQADRLHRLINELLDVSRISSGRLEMEIEDVDLTQLAFEVGARFQDEAVRAGCELTIDAARAVSGRWDRSRLEQVITNMVTNALKYGQGKPIRVTVEGGEEGDGATARLSVNDQGVGIAAEDQARIFDRFERASSSRSFGGIGLGLWIVKQIVHALDGEVRVESALGEGATFIVELPYGPASDAKESVR
jgi:PAS domain S-box-containing protein